MNKLYITIALIIFNLNLFSQEYFQQEVNYRIDVFLDDINHELFAEETITYINNSPDTLNFIYFHIWANAYKNNSTAFARQQLDNGVTNFYFAPQEQKGYIDSLDFKRCWALKNLRPLDLLSWGTVIEKRTG